MNHLADYEGILNPANDSFIQEFIIAGDQNFVDGYATDAGCVSSNTHASTSL